MRTLERRLLHIEEFLQRTKEREPHTVRSACGRVEASVSYHKHSTLPAVVIHYDSLTLEAEEALDLVDGQLPAYGHLYVFPNELTVEEWEAEAQKYLQNKQ